MIGSSLINFRCCKILWIVSCTGADAGAAPSPVTRATSGSYADPPTCQLISSLRQHPGSGALAIRLQPAGPTKVLQIFDMRDKRLQRSSMQEDWVMVDVEKVASRQLVVNRLKSESGTNVDEEPDVPSSGFKVSCFLGHVQINSLFPFLQPTTSSYVYRLVFCCFQGDFSLILPFSFLPPALSICMAVLKLLNH